MDPGLWLHRHSRAFTGFKFRQDFSSPSYPSIMINNQTVSIVKHAKLLGVTVSNGLKWNLHVNAVCMKASKRLYTLRLLKRNGLPDSVLVKVYCTYMLDLLYPWVHMWSVAQQPPLYLSNQIEQIQKRALQIIYPSFTYNQAMLTANFPSLYNRRSTLCERFFHRMFDPGHKLNSLVPALSLRVNEHNLIGVLRFQFVELIAFIRVLSWISFLTLNYIITPVIQYFIVVKPL